MPDPDLAGSRHPAGGTDRDDAEDDDHDGDAMAALPGTMADLFLALVAVVVLMLLSLIPAIATPGGLAAGLSPSAEPWRTNGVTLDGEPTTVLIAERDGLAIVGVEAGTEPVAAARAPRDTGRRVDLDAIFGDAGLAAALAEASEGRRRLLLVIEPDGGEAAFLFDAMASRAGVGTYAQMRLGSDCAGAGRSRVGPSRACPPGVGAAISQ